MAQDLGASMDTARKLNDCYFYYYSTCTKGDNCVFRHEPSALGCETMCAAWQQGKCVDKKCKLRHMELRKNRKQIPCYWESQPCGCRKKHCPFMHRNPEARTDGIAPSQMTSPPVAGTGSNPPMERGVCEPPVVPLGGGVPAMPGGMPGRVPTASVQPTVASVPLIWQRELNRSVMLETGILGVLPASSELMASRPPPPNYAAVPVDSLVVNFDEESECDSTQSTPKKAVPGGEDGNQDEEMKLLERIQAEAAAYYSYSGEQTKEQTQKTNNPLDFKIMSLDEIRARKKSIDTHTPTINFNRKRKFSQETIIDSGNKIMKLVRSNSIVYRKVDNAPPPTVVRHEVKVTASIRNRTQSEHSDLTEKHETELLDYDSQFKKIETEVHTIKPILIRNRHSDPVIDIDKNKDKSVDSEIIESTNISSDFNTSSEFHSTIDCETIELDGADSDPEVQVIEDVYKNIEGHDSLKISDPVVVDLCDDDDIVEVNSKNFPDVVTSCQSSVSGDRVNS